MILLLIIVLVSLIVSIDSYRCYNYRNQIINKSYRKISSSSSLLILNDSKRKIVGRDNLGEPIYEDDINTSEGISVLGNIYNIIS
jgi:hypothetical protein